MDLPWWGSIVLLAAVIRLALFPLQLRLTANNSRLAIAAPKMKAIAAELQKAKEEEDRAALMAASTKMRAIYAESGANPLKSFLGPLVQVPIALSMFFAIRRMCNLPVESLKVGGTQWFVDLTAADPYYILPIMSTAAMMSMLKMSTKDTPQTAASGHMSNFFLVLSAISFPVMAAFPSGLLVYFVANGVLLAVQSAVMRIPAVRKYAGIVSPPPPEGGVEKKPNLIESAQAVVKYFSDAKQQAMEASATASSEKMKNQRRELEHLIKMKKSQQPKNHTS
ncbi:Mitochondrial inner membrane protein oxa1l [Tulasnella sp. 419]|nr:Mitochondrial inner membrane protein oxa1l [Tulasnella sp. 419]